MTAPPNLAFGLRTAELLKTCWSQNQAVSCVLLGGFPQAGNLGNLLWLKAGNCNGFTSARCKEVHGIVND